MMLRKGGIVRNKRKYTKEFIADAVRLVLEEGYSPIEASRSLGIPDSTLHNWLKKARRGEVPDDGNLSQAELLAELKELKKKNRRLQMERDILKKATAFFARNED